MSINDELVPVLKKLRLSGMLKTLDLRTKEAVDGEIRFDLRAVLAKSLYELLRCDVHVLFRYGVFPTHDHVSSV